MLDAFSKLKTTMNALTALKLVKSKGETSMQPIFKKIEKAALLGNYELHFYEALTDFQKKELQGLGYNVTYTNYRNEPTTTISWKTPTHS